MSLDIIWESIIGILLILGGLFYLAGSIGILRLPDTYCKLHALTNPITMGAITLTIAYIIFLIYVDINISYTSIIAVFFLLITTPIGIHMLIKAVYQKGYKMCNSNPVDKLKEDLES